MNIIDKIINTSFFVMLGLLILPNVIFAGGDLFSGYATDYYTPSNSSSFGGYATDYYDYGGFGGYATDYYDYGGFGGYATDYYDYGGTNSYGYYEDYYTPSYGGYYEDYYTPSYSSGCYYGSCGGYSYGSRGSSPVVLGLSYSNSDRSSVTKVNNNIDNSVRINNDNDTTTTVTNTSIDSHDNNSINNSFNTVAYAENRGNNNSNDNLNISCRVSGTRIEKGDSVTYEVRINDGRSPYDITWRGDISGDDEEERVRYNRTGTYEVSVRVRDRNGDTDTADCPDVRVTDNDDDNNNITVTTSTNLNRTNGNLASLDSIFLSQVPYTGPGDILKVLGILAVIGVWSAVVAVWFRGKRTAKSTTSKINAFKEQNKNSAKIA